MKSCDAKIAISNVLLATDFSRESAQAVACARSLAENYNARVHVVNVMDLFPFSLRDDDEATARMEQIKATAEERMKEFTRAHHLHGKEFDSALLSGEPYGAIERFRREHGIDLIVLGSRGDAGLRRLFEGSVAEEIFRSALCPVMIAGPRARMHEGMLNHLLFATDMGRVSQAAARYLEFLLSANTAARVILAHFLEKEESNVYTRHQLRRMREQELTEMLGPEFRPQIADVIVEACTPGDGMLTMIEELGADLLVLGVRSGGAFTRATTHAPLSIAPRVISEARCPVLTVRGE
ncbi:MAG TPA: universal stress protein [Candidatus Angelobacter sp.]|nr:universal stress protein [Candidatus Angelobacter sp.]